MISINDLSVAYGNWTLLDRISFHISESDKIGLVGKNGAGKSTILKLLCGEQSPSSGTIDKPQHVTMGYLPQIMQHNKGRTVLEEAMTAFDAFKAMEEEIAEITVQLSERVDYESASYLNLITRLNDLNDHLAISHNEPPEVRAQRTLLGLGFKDEELSRKTETFSQGWNMRIELAKILLGSPDVLLLDEPTNHLDIESRKIVSEYLRRQKGFLLVSHDRAFLDGCVDHILSIGRNEIEVRKGDFSGWYHDYQTRIQSEREQNEKLKKEISRLHEAAKRTAEWSDRVEATKIGEGPCDRGYIGHKAAKMMKRSKSIEMRKLDAAQEKSKLLKNVENVGKLKIQPEKHFAKKLVEVGELSICFDGEPLFSPVSFSVGAGEKVCLQGKNGCGKTSLLKLIAGEELDYQGTLRIASGLTFSVVSQDTSGLQGSLQEELLKSGVDQSLCMTILRNLGFERAQFEIPLEQYSMGQKKKVLIAKSLCQKAHLYLWDEPLNYIDIFSRMQIEKLLLEQEAAMLFVEHDAAFCENIADKIVSIQRI